VDARVEARLATPPSAEQTQKQLQELKAALQADPEFAAAIAKAGTADLHAMAACISTVARDTNDLRNAWDRHTPKAPTPSLPALRACGAKATGEASK
jgi:alkylated DNA repair dioxygenase AlkB